MFTSVLFAISFTRPIVCHMLVQWHFKCPAERRDEANRVLELNFQNRMTQMLYQEKKKARRYTRMAKSLQKSWMRRAIVGQPNKHLYLPIQKKS
jgi:hypothetical protein